MPSLPLPPSYRLLRRWSERPEGAVVEAEHAGQRLLVRLARGGAEEARSELALLASFQHPDVAGLTDHGPLPGGGLFLARPFVEGVDLERWAEGQPPERLAEVAARLTVPLVALHRAGFVHGDLKASNVIVREGGRPLLVDFGLASNRAGAIGGTDFYLAPEVLRGRAHTPAADAFALGALLQRLLAPSPTTAREFYGRFPARPYLEALELDVEALPTWSRDLVVGLTARDPARRPALVAVARTLATRLGFELEDVDDVPWNLGDTVGRASWFEERLRIDLSRDEGEPRRSWWSAPNADDARALFRALHLRLSLRNRGESGLDLARLTGTDDPGELMKRAEAAAADWTGTTAVLAVDDSAWSHRALALVEGLARARSEHESLVVIGLGPAPAPFWTNIEVPKLAPDEVVVHAVERFGTGVEAAAERIAAVTETRADLLATLADAHARGILLVTESGWELVPGAPLRTPGATATVDEEERRILETLALLGAVASLGSLARILERSPAEVAPVVAALLARRTIARDDAGRLIAVERAEHGSRAARTELLRRASAELLLDAEQEVRAAALDLAARLRASDEDAGDALAALAGMLADERERGAPERVLAIVDELESLLAEVDRSLADDAFELALVRVDAWLDLGRADRAELELSRLAAPADAELAGRLALVRARLADRTHRADDAFALLDEAARIAPALAPRALAERVFLLGRRGEDRRVLELAGQLEGHSVGALDERSAWTLRSTLAMSRFRAGEVDAARQELAALLRDVASHPGREAGVQLNLAIVERRAGSLPRAIEHLRAAHYGFRARGDLVGVAHTAATLGGVLRDAGELAEAEVELQRAIDLRTRLGDRAGVIAVEALEALVAFERGHAQLALDGLESSVRRAGNDLPRGFRALLGARAVELRARLGEPPARDRAASDDESIDPRALLALARAERFAGRPKRVVEFAQRARDLARSLRLESVVAEARLLLAEHDQSAAAELADAGPLVRDDVRCLELLSAGASIDVAATDAFATELELRGRDDRAARLLFALAARADRAIASGARTRAERLFEVVAAGLGDERRAALRRTLLGRPDPHSSDLQPRPALDDDSLDDMAIRTLHNLHERLLTENDLSALLQSIVEAAIELTGAERGFLVLEEDGELHFDLALDSARGGIARPELETSRTIVTDALTRGRPLRLSNAADDPSTADHASVMSLELRSILCVPFDATPEVRGVLVLDHRLRTGAFDERAEELAELIAGTAALAVQKVYRSEAAASSLGSPERAATPPSGAIIGSSPAMSRLAEQIARIAPSELSVLIVGASGTGKELAARALFEQSLRSDGPFVAENCAALPPSLIESELFGHRRGAFTGADRDHAGLFERAHGGTLFLDEIGELPLELQARLLRVLENGELRRVGDDRVRRVDVRLLTATNRDLEREVEEGRFRQDLLYRLDGARLAMPTLAERREDVPELVRYFLERISERTGVRRRIASTVLAALVERPWPGNVRELKNEIERLCVLTDGDLDDPSLVRSPARPVTTDTSQEIESLAAVEQRAILRALEASGGDKREAARKLGISRAKIYQRLKEWSEGDSTSG